MITISQQALEIAEDDDERVSFWEQMVPASLFLAKADDVETFGDSTGELNLMYDL